MSERVQYFPALQAFPLDPVIGAHPAALRVYLRLLTVLDLDQPYAVKQWLLAEELCLKRSTVARALALLVERGYIVETGRGQNNVGEFKLSWRCRMLDAKGT